jgi:hypothetical protein
MGKKNQDLDRIAEMVTHDLEHRGGSMIESTNGEITGLTAVNRYNRDAVAAHSGTDVWDGDNDV